MLFDPLIEFPLWAQRRSWPEPRQADTASRHAYGRDRSRIIHSASFRRLQAKTQVLGLHESDFYRTRLTHSLEVAQIGSGIVDFLTRQSPQTPAVSAWLPDPFLIEAICLAHDLGHPPFGHGGEVALNYLMRNHGGFEGNGQSLRILSRLGEHSEHHGQDLTRRALLGVMKYPVIYEDVVRRDADYVALCTAEPGNFRTQPMKPWYPPKSLLAEEREVRDWVLAALPGGDAEHFIQAQTQDQWHARACYHSLDTSIMDIADDIAYGVHDLEDAIAMGLLDEHRWRADVMSQSVFAQSTAFDAEQVTQWLFSGNSRARKRGISHLVGAFIRATQVIEQQEFEHPLLRYQVQMMPEVAAALELLKVFVYDQVISLPEVKSFEYKGQLMVMELFTVLWANPDRLLPRSTQQKMELVAHEQGRMRVLCDYVAGMTDDYATRLYAKLFNPYYGSIFDQL